MGRGDKHFSKDIIETQIQKDICIPMFTATLFTMAKIWKPPEGPPTDEGIKKAVVHLYNAILLGHKKE